MRKLVLFVLAAFAVALVPAGVQAQDGVVSGRVIERVSQAPLQAVQVTVEGTQRGARTDQEGRYTISGLAAGTYQIRARRVGYAPVTQQVTVGAGATSTVNFTMDESAAQLEEVLVNAVTGQEQRRLELGVNVGNINVGDMNKGPITKMADVLQGRVAGVTLQSVVGTSGGGQRIRIRGANSISLSNEPLIFMDGIRISNSKGGLTLGGQDYSRLNDINPDEIENIDILKGPAAAAMYGSVANNGVILITTKRGRAGRPQWRAYLEGSTMEDKTDYPLNFAALQIRGDGTEPHFRNEFGGFLNITTWFGAAAPYAICANVDAAAGSCTQDRILSYDYFGDPRTRPFQTGSRSKYGINVSGGSEALTYYISGDSEKELGVLRPNDVDRISLRTNLNARIGSNANATITAAYINANNRRMSNDNSVFSPLINGFLGPAEYLEGMESDTVRTAGDRLGSFFGWNTADQRKVTADQALDRFVIGTNANYTPLPWLRMNGSAGLDYFGRYDRADIDPNELPLALSYIIGWRQSSRASNYLWTSNASASGVFNIRPSLLSTTTFGVTYDRALFEDVLCYGEGIPAGTRSCGASTSGFAVDEAHTDLKTIGGLFRQELALNDRLFLSGSVRADNNSGLVRDVSGLAYYPAANVSWVVSQEPFFPAMGFLSQLRLRLGWGRAGQRPGFGDADTFFGSRASEVGGLDVAALILTSTGNPNLKVEKTTEIEGGFDASFFDNRFNLEFTSFTRRSKDALVRRNLAPSSGLTGSIFQNLGSVKNWGTEFGLNADLINTEWFNFAARVTATTLKNKIEVLGEGIAPIVINRGEQAHREGFPTGAYFARPIKYNDANGDGKLSVSEVSVDSSKFLVVRNADGGLDTLPLAFVGPSLPTNTQGLGFDVTLFRNLTISTLFERRAGHRQNNQTAFFRCRTLRASPFAGQCSALSNPDATLAEQAAFIGSNFAAFGATPYGYIEDATFTKWRELSFRFGFPQSLGERFGALRGSAISVSGRNLATWTDYTGLDPEINESGGGNFNQGEFNTQPPVRVWTLRFDFQL